MRFLCCALALVSTMSLANADEKEDARGHVAKATQAHARGDFETALAELEIAYELDPLPELLFATAQVHVRLERCPAAITYYERYLKTNPATQARLDTQQAIATCKQRIADAKRAEPPAPAADRRQASTPRETSSAPPRAAKAEATSSAKAEATSSTASSAPPRVAKAEATSSAKPDATSTTASSAPPRAAKAEATRPRRAVASRDTAAHDAREDAAPHDLAPASAAPWYHDKVGGVLVASGAVAGIAALALYSRARGDLDDAEGATTIADYRSAVNDARGTRTLAVVFGIGSGVLLGAGVVRYALKRPPAHERRLAIVPAGDGGLVTWSGGF